MKNANIAKVLKFYRKKNEYSVSQVAEFLENNNLSVAEKTIYGWESGQTQPDADTLLLLCKIYNIEDILTTFGYDASSDPQLHLTTFELKLIQKYREHPELQDAIKKLLEL